MELPLNSSKLNVSPLILSPDVLGDGAFVILLNAFGIKDFTPVTLNNAVKVDPSKVEQSVNQFVVDGDITFLPGANAASVSVRIYLFEVPSKVSNQGTDRHCIVLVKSLPSGYSLDDFWKAVGIDSQITNLLNTGSALTQGLMLFSTLDYTDNAYQKPAFPPSADTSLSSDEQAFVKAIAADVTCGFSYQVNASVNPKVAITSSVTAQDALAPLKMTTDIFSKPISFLAQTNLLKTNQLQLVLRILITGAKIENADKSISLALTEFGLIFPVEASTATTLPTIIVKGGMTFGSSDSSLQASYDLQTQLLNITVSALPDFDQLKQQFSKLDLIGEMSKQLPSNQQGANSSLLDSLTIQNLMFLIDVSDPSLGYFEFTVTTDAPYELANVVKVMPQITVKVSNPFTPASEFELDVLGDWRIGSTDIATILTLQDDVFTLNASLVSGSINVSDIIETILLGQVKNIPSLTIASFDFYAIHSKTDPANQLYQAEIGIASAWNLGGFPLVLDDATIYVKYAGGQLYEAAMSANLSLAGTVFDINAAYNADDHSWEFSGGLTSTVKVSDVITALADELHIPITEGNKFLDSLTDIDITGFYITCTMPADKSSGFGLNLSLSSAKGFAGIPLTTLFIQFNTIGKSIHWQVAGLNTTPQPGAVAQLQNYLQTNTDIGIKVDLPQAIIDLHLVALTASYNSELKNYSFAAVLAFGDNNNAQLRLEIDIFQQVDGSKTKEVVGQLIFYPGDDQKQMALDVLLEASGTSKAFVATYSAPDAKPLDLFQLLFALDPNAPAALKTFSLSVQKALFVYRFADSSASPPTKSSWLFAIDMDAGINLSGLGNLPIVGSALSAAQRLELALQIVYASGADFSQADLVAINKAYNLSTFRFPEGIQSVKAGSPVVASSLRIGNQNVLDMGLNLSTNPDGTLKQSSNNLPLFDPQGSTAKTGNISWFNLKKSFGPVLLERVGLSFATSGILSVYLDGQVSIGELAVDLLGLSVSVKLTGANKFTPQFDLEGLGMNFQKGGTDITGGLVKFVTPAGLEEFDGFLSIRAEELEIGAVGSFAQLGSGAVSLFVYATLDAPLGGPIFFFVTGLAAGFGYNRRLHAPPIDQLTQFPLVSQAIQPPTTGIPTDPSQIKDYVSAELASMETYITPSVGEYFLAAGINFTSFELIESFLLATVSFGKSLEIDIFGVSTILLPPDDPNSPLAEAQLAIEALVIPDEGIVEVEGQLTPASFILSRDCHLTGGFAVAFWTGGDHAGDFVITLGGYHPDFNVPSYYPNPPRVGFNWQVNSHLSVKGGGYFALVPHAFMAGGSFQAVWQSGSVKAWFDLNSNFLIAWKPYHYDAEVSVDMGAELTIHFFGTHHVSIDVNADLHVWGPEFGGHARMTVHVIGIHVHFSIDFGASNPPPQPIPWDNFSSSFLPASDKLLSATAKSGLMNTVHDAKNNRDIWVVNRSELVIETNTFFPVNSSTINILAQSATTNTYTKTGVAPMNVKTVTASDHKITITCLTGQARTSLVAVPIEKGFPDALWGSTMDRELNPPDGEKIISSYSGFQIVQDAPSLEEQSPLVVLKSLLAYTAIDVDIDHWTDTGTFTPTTPPGNETGWDAVQTQIFKTQAQREALLEAMGIVDQQSNFNVALSKDELFPPVYGVLGD